MKHYVLSVLCVAVLISACGRDVEKSNLSLPGSPSTLTKQKAVDGTVTTNHPAQALKVGAGGKVGQVYTDNWFTVDIQEARNLIEYRLNVFAPSPYAFTLDPAATHWDDIDNDEATENHREVWPAQVGSKTSFGVGETGIATWTYALGRCYGRGQNDVNMFFADGTYANIVGHLVHFSQRSEGMEHYRRATKNVVEADGTVTVSGVITSLNVPDDFVELLWAGWLSGVPGEGPRGENWFKDGWWAGAKCDNVPVSVSYSWSGSLIQQLPSRGASYRLTKVDDDVMTGKATQR